jgi:hypothetical protein
MAIVTFKFRVSFKGEDLGVMDSNKVTMNEALQLEDKTGFTLQELVSRLSAGSAKAIQAVVWFQLLRSGKPVELFQDFTFEDFDVDPVQDEPDPTQAADAADETSTSPSKSAAGSPSHS